MIVEAVGPDDLHEQEGRGRQHAADEGEQQQDRRQRHPPPAVKNSASAQAVAATASGARKLGPVSPWSEMNSPVAWPMLWPIQPTANSRIAAAIETKMSLKPVISRNCSSSGMAVERWRSMCATQRVRGFGGDHARSDRVVEVLLTVHALFSPQITARIGSLYYSVNTACRPAK